MPPTRALPHLVIPAARQLAVFDEEPDAGLPAPGVPGHPSVHTQGVASGAPAGEAAGQKVLTKDVFVN